MYKSVCVCVCVVSRCVNKWITVMEETSSKCCTHLTLFSPSQALETLSIPPSQRAYLRMCAHVCVCVRSPHKHTYFCVRQLSTCVPPRSSVFLLSLCLICWKSILPPLAPVCQWGLNPIDSPSTD